MIQRDSGNGNCCMISYDHYAPSIQVTSLTKTDTEYDLTDTPMQKII